MLNLSGLSQLSEFALFANIRYRNFLTAAMLIGIYGGVVAYCTYAKYVKQIEDSKAQVGRVGVEMVVGEEQSFLEPTPATASELQLPRIREPVRLHNNVVADPQQAHNAATFRTRMDDD